ncbi:MAG: MFS transporter [Alphaproteobacteria bacterium]|nr:MFS transporter [Alphaproteobacteria bacterium]
MTVATPRAPGISTRLAYGLGGVAFGVKDSGFSFFLLIFYSQVIGLDARLVGLALTIALVADAISDPVVGYWSDVFRSRWGRRHVFMYASAIPVTVSYFLLWRPPGSWNQTELFWYLLTLAVLTRTFITFFETPSAALAPELSRDYDQRSVLMSYRTFFGWAGGNAMTVIMFFFLFPAFATGAIPQGQLNPAAYVAYAGISAALIFLSIMTSSLGTHSWVSRLVHPEPRRLTLVTVFRDMFETLANRSFVALFIAAIFAFVASGLVSALSVYFSTYFWAFSSVQIGEITLAVFVSALLGAAIAPLIAQRLNKKRAAIVIGGVALIVSPLAVALRLFGVLSDGGDPATFWSVLVIGQISVALTVAFQALMASMIADLVEQSELKTGRRSEGVFFAANTFVQKMVSGVGVMAAALILALARFPANATPSAVPDEVLQRLGWYYIPALVLLQLGMLSAIAFYSLDRRTHEKNLQRLGSASPKA